MMHRIHLCLLALIAISLRIIIAAPVDSPAIGSRALDTIYKINREISDALDKMPTRKKNELMASCNHDANPRMCITQRILEQILPQEEWEQLNGMKHPQNLILIAHCNGEQSLTGCLKERLSHLRHKQQDPGLKPDASDPKH